MRTTLKQQQQKNLSPKEFCLSHAKPIFITRLNKLPITKWKKKWKGGKGKKKKKESGYDSSLQKKKKKAKRGCPKVLQWEKQTWKEKKKKVQLLLFLSA